MAERYRKVQVEIWGDEEFRALSLQAKLVFLFLITHPNLTSFGAMRGTVPGLAAELGCEIESFRESFDELLVKPFVRLDEAASLIVLPKFIKHNAPRNPNTVKSWAKVVPTLPKCELLSQHIKEVVTAVKPMGGLFVESLAQSFGNKPGTIARIGKGKQEEGKGKKPPPTPTPPKPPKPDPYEGFDDFWAVYPRPVNITRAKKSWKAQGCGAMNGAVTVAVENQLKWGMFGDDEQFIPHPATWLNNKRWEEKRPEKQTRGAKRGYGEQGQSPQDPQFVQDLREAKETAEREGE